jgi:putrescine importer
MTQPTLDRSLGLRSIVLFGLAYMAPMIVLGTFGAIAEETGGAVPSAYVLALIAMLFTAYSYGRLAATYPVAGSAYTYVRRAIDDRVGFLVGWATLLDYFFLPMVIWLSRCRSGCGWSASSCSRCGTSSSPRGSAGGSARRRS